MIGNQRHIPPTRVSCGHDLHLLADPGRKLVEAFGVGDRPDPRILVEVTGQVAGVVGLDGVDTVGVEGRKSGRSKYGAKRPKL